MTLQDLSNRVQELLTQLPAQTDVVICIDTAVSVRLVPIVIDGETKIVVCKED
jgi:hypothetical protein